MQLERTSHVLGYTPIHNVAGCPAMSVPLLLALAYQLERAQPWQHRWPPYSIPALFG